MLDVFKTDAFSVLSLTDAINKEPVNIGRLGQLGIFRASGVTTTRIAIEEKDGVFRLIGPTPRGGPGETMPKPLRSARPFIVPHFQIDDAIMADEVQGVRAFGSETEVEMVATKVSERLNIAAQQLRNTQELSRLGAIKGIVTYADGSTLDLFDEFDVSANSTVFFNFASNPALGVLRGQVSGMIRTIAAALGGTPFSGVHVMCGDTLFDDVLAARDRLTTIISSDGDMPVITRNVVTGSGLRVVDFLGVTWENYRGYEEDGDPLIAADKGYAIPLGVPGLFRTYYAPADYIETVNTVGRELYAKQIEMRNGKGVELESQMNALDICTRPKALVTVDNGAS